MASATIAHEAVIGTCPVASIPAWWQRGHSYVFMAVAICEIALTWGVVRLIENSYNLAAGWEQIASAAMIGFLFAQCFLLGLWAALGGLGTIPRWLAVGTVAALGGLAITFEFITPQWQEFLYQGPEIAALAALTATGFAVLLLPLRRLAGWRVDFDAAYHPSTGRRRGQLELMDFAAMFCAVALPLTLGRVLIELMGESGAADIGVFIPVFVGIALLSAAPAAFAVLARRRAWFWLGMCLGWLFIVCLAQSILTACFPDLDVFGGGSTGREIVGTTFAFHL